MVRTYTFSAGSTRKFCINTVHLVQLTLIYLKKPTSAIIIIITTIIIIIIIIIINIIIIIIIITIIIIIIILRWVVHSCVWGSLWVSQSLSVEWLVCFERQTVLYVWWFLWVK